MYKLRIPGFKCNAEEQQLVYVINRTLGSGHFLTTGGLVDLGFGGKMSPLFSEKASALL